MWQIPSLAGKSRERKSERERETKKWGKIGSGSKTEKCHPEGKKEGKLNR